MREVIPICPVCAHAHRSYEPHADKPRPRTSWAEWAAGPTPKELNDELVRRQDEVARQMNCPVNPEYRDKYAKRK